MKPGDRVRVVNPRPSHERLRGLEGHVASWPARDVRVRLLPSPKIERTLLYFREGELELVTEEPTTP